MLTKLSRSKLGCSVYNMSVCAIMYADDLLLMSSLFVDLQGMIDICLDHLDSLDMTINESKSCCIKIGHRFSFTPAKLKVHGLDLPWVSSFKFLGHIFLAGTNMKCDFHLIKSKFFGFNF